MPHRVRLSFTLARTVLDCACSCSATTNATIEYHARQALPSISLFLCWSILRRPFFRRWDFAQLGITPDMPRNAELVNETSYPLYEAKLRDEIAKRKMSAEVLNGVKKGDLVIWANSLLHGGSQVLNNSMTRLSQVTHFFFEPTEIAWSPRLSPEDRHLHRRSPETWAALAQASKLRMTNPMALHAGHMQEGMTTPGRRATAALRGF